MIDVQMGEEHAGQFAIHSLQYLGCALLDLESFDVHHFLDQPIHPLLAGIIHQLSRHARVHQVIAALRMFQQVGIDLYRFVAVFQSGLNCCRAIQIQQASERHRPVRAVYGLQLDRPRLVDQAFHLCTAGCLAQRRLAHRMAGQRAALQQQDQRATRDQCKGVSRFHIVLRKVYLYSHIHISPAIG